MAAHPWWGPSSLLTHVTPSKNCRAKKSPQFPLHYSQRFPLSPYGFFLLLIKPLQLLPANLEGLVPVARKKPFGQTNRPTVLNDAVLSIFPLTLVRCNGYLFPEIRSWYTSQACNRTLRNLLRRFRRVLLQATLFRLLSFSCWISQDPLQIYSLESWYFLRVLHKHLQQLSLKNQLPVLLKNRSWMYKKLYVSSLKDPHSLRTFLRISPIKTSRLSLKDVAARHP